MKDSRNPNNWSNRELEQDTAGYLAAQQAYRQDQAAAAAQRQAEQDLERFTKSFVVAGGTRADAHDAYRAKRNAEAAEAAAHADEAARLAQRGATWSKV
jgi:membrane protein involved in colicin uptake